MEPKSILSNVPIVDELKPHAFGSRYNLNVPSDTCISEVEFVGKTASNACIDCEQLFVFIDKLFTVSK